MLIFIMLIFFLFIISFFFKRENLDYYFLFASFSLALLAFFFEPFIDLDLYRHFEFLNSLRINGWSAVEANPLYKYQPLYGYYFYIISLLPSNGYLPAITMFIIYYVVFKTIYKVGIKNNLSKNFMLATFFFFILSFDYLSALSGIRNMLAFSLFAYFLYKELIEKKNKFFSWIVYIFLCFFHSSVSILLLFRLLLFISTKKTYYLLLGLTALWLFFAENISSLLSNYTSVVFFDYLHTKVISSINSSRNDYFTASITFLAIIILSLLLIFLVSKVKKVLKTKQYEKYYMFIIYIVIFVISSVSNYDVFMRFSSMLFILAPTALMILKSELKQRSFIKVSFNKKIDIIFVIMIIIVLIRWGMLFFIYKNNFNYYFL